VTPEQYYTHDDVRARLREGCGGRGADPPTAAYVAALDPAARRLPTWDAAERCPPERVGPFLARGLDLSRSLWDREHLIVMIELDYLNLDLPAEPFLRPVNVFFKMEPAYRAARRVFRALGLRLRTAVTGRGYQFAGQVPLDDDMVTALGEMVEQPPAWLDSAARWRQSGLAASITERHARAWSGLGLLLEHLAHTILQEAAPRSAIPVVFNGTVVGSGRVGRECVAIDFSHAGDPLPVRHMRLAFSTYQWHRQRPDIFGAHTAAVTPPLATILRGRETLMTLMSRGRGLDEGVTAARAADGTLPTVTRGLRALLESYRSSPLARFHDALHAARRLRRPFRAIDAAVTPPCVAATLARPNDLLLKPEHIQHVVRVLRSLDWDAADIAALVESRYREDHGWGDRWTWMEPRSRADFDVRVFAGLIATGHDSLVDFNCVSAQEKDICPRSGCVFDLRHERDRLRAASPA
jgi:hypothetical protein